MSQGTDQISDDEVLYRRIPLRPEYHNPSVHPHPTPLAFNPGKQDVSGLSLYRAKYVSAEEMARKGRGKQYYIAALRAGDVRAAGMQVVPREIEPEDGHAEIPELNYDDRKSSRAKEMMMLLSQQLILEILGPLP